MCEQGRIQTDTDRGARRVGYLKETLLQIYISSSTRNDTIDEAAILHCEGYVDECLRSMNTRRNGVMSE